MDVLVRIDAHNDRGRARTDGAVVGHVSGLSDASGDTSERASGQDCDGSLEPGPYWVTAHPTRARLGECRPASRQINAKTQSRS